MKLATTAKILATGLALLMLVFEVAANDPIFVKWLVMDDPGDETIRIYWQRAEAGELDAEELVDLGTMLFYRGWPNDAVTYFRQALDLDPELSDAWFRIGLVEHHSGDLSAARSAYKKCLKKQSGHAWANFYLGLLEEQTGEGKSAMQHFEMAFKHAPELANPKVNPEILSSRLQLGAQVRHFDGERFEGNMPMPFMAPAEMRKVQKQFEVAAPPVATPAPEVTSRITPTPVPGQTNGGGSSRVPTTRRPQGSAAAATGGSARSGQTGGGGGSTAPSQSYDSTPYGVPRSPGQGSTGSGSRSTAPAIGEASPEASLLPAWPDLYEIAKALV